MTTPPGPARRTTATTVLAVAVAVAVGVAGCGTSTPGGGAPATSTGSPPTTAPSAADEPASGPTPAEPTVVEVSTLDGEGCPDDTVDADFPDVVGARFEPVDDAAGAYRVAVTLCSRYDTPTRHADAWRVVTPDGDVLATRELLHDHAAEQPFTRSLTGTLTVPADVATVVVEARDLANGWGGTRLEVPLSR